jgi:O-succinylbenzoic acid--CoA ligase
MLAGTVPVSLSAGSFTPERFVAATSELVESTPVGVPLYVSLVPTQWRRLAQDRPATSALRAYAAVLVGGAAVGAGARTSTVVETYGATETSGGCVYDGLPLDGVAVALDPDGRVLIGGPTLAHGYADGDDESFVVRDGERWWRSTDLGEFRQDRLVIAGRADDIIVTGGDKVHPEVVEEVVSALPGVAGCVVVGVPDSEWGERVVAIVAQDPGKERLTVETLRLALRATLPRYSLPRDLVAVESLPTLAGGKIDRVAARLLAARAAGRGNDEHDR